MRLVVAFVVLFIVAEASALNHQQASDLVQKIRDASTAKDADKLSALFAEDAKLSVNGKVSEGRAAIKEHFTATLSKLYVQNSVVTSPFYISGDAFHYIQQAFYAREDPKLGECVAVVHSVERISVNAAGLISSQRSEWEETTKQFEDDLKCEHDEKHHEHEAIQDKIIEKAFERHRHFESLNLQRFVKTFATDAVVVDGASQITGAEAIKNFYVPFFTNISTISFAPSTPVFVREKSTFSVSSVFLITNTGCNLSGQIVFYNTYNDRALVTLSEQYPIGFTSAQLLETVTKDCGRVKPEASKTALLEEDEAIADEEIEEVHDDEL